MKERRLIIEGGYPLRGKVKIGGSKNAALPCLAASILSNESVTIENVPIISDVNVMIDILRSLNVKVNCDITGRKVNIDASNLSSFEIPHHLSSLMRGSMLLLGSLLARNRRVRMHGYGGCQIGSRPINLHLKAFNLLGAKVKGTAKLIEIMAEELRGNVIRLDFPSVGATENAIMAACFAKGQTVIINAAIEPEIINLMDMLKAMGACVDVDVVERIITIGHSEELGGVKHVLIPDRIEAGTYAVAAAIIRGTLLLRDVNIEHLKEIINKLRSMNVCVEELDKETLEIFPKRARLKGIELITAPYPGFPTDMQPQFTSLATTASGITSILETIYDDRLHHVPELKKMGAKIDLRGRKIIVKGPAGLSGTRVQAKDIRGGVALVLAGLRAKGTTVICNAQRINRGYENIVEKLRNVNAKIEVIEDA